MTGQVTGNLAKKLRVDVWSDIACPWCYVGKRRFEAALASFAHRDAVELVWRAFELDPSAPQERDPSVSHTERLAKKYRVSVAEAEAMHARLSEVARGEGLDFHFERIRSGNTFDAHRVVHWARSCGLQDAVKERFLRGYLTEGEPIGDRETLVRMAAEVGLAADEVRALLASDAESDAVRADEAEAQEAGIHGVPCFVFGGRYAVSGAQTKDVLLSVLQKAWDELAAKPLELELEGAACGPDGCA